MYADIRKSISTIIAQAVESYEPGSGALPVLIDAPADKANGDFSCNIALQLTRKLKMNPALIAQGLIDSIDRVLEHDPLRPSISRIETKAGFINFYLSQDGYSSFLADVFKLQQQYGQGTFGNGVAFCLEFVSANPTGPLTVAHARQAAVGDTLGNILKTVGFDLEKEYYVNDEGNQINILGRSLETRARQILGSKEELFEDAYQGEYIRTMAGLFLQQRNITSMEQLNAVNDNEYRDFGVAYLMKVIQEDLKDFDVHFDVWSYQSKIATKTAIEGLLNDFKAKGYVYQNQGAWWFKSTQWKDDKDRVVQKSNGDYTYLTPDIVYHQDKFARGFKRVVNLLGPDHHGYIPRIKAAAGALGKDVDDLDVIIVQLATIFRDGKEVSMSTRRGEFITLREVIDEVGKDAGRFFLLMRQSNAHLEFDLELAKRQSAENPVYYIQYAHARIFSIIRKAQGETGLKPDTVNFNRLVAPEEIDLMRKIGFYPECLVSCAKMLEPFGLVRYLQELAGCFHKFYDACRVIDEDKEMSSQRLGLIEATRIVLGNGLKILGVSAPEKM